MTATCLRVTLAWVIAASSTLANADDSVEFVHGLSAKDYQSEFERLTADGFRPLSFSTDDVNGQPQFCALFVKDGRPLGWMAKHHLTADEFNKSLGDQERNGFRPIWATAYPVDGQPRFGAIWVKDGGTRRSRVRYGLSAAQWAQNTVVMAGQGLRPQVVSACNIGNSVRLAALFVEAGRQAFKDRLDLLEPQAKAFVLESAAQGLRPVSISAYSSPRGTRFALVVVKDGVDSELKFSLTEEQLKTEIEAQRAAGRRPRTATAYRGGNTNLHAVIFEKLPDTLPVSGAEEPRLAILDESLQRYFREEKIRGATVAVSREGRLVFSRGYGFRDAEELETLPADAILRIASVTKPVTAIAVRKLIRDGKIGATTPIFDLLAMAPPDGQILDPRWKLITVEHLLSHRGGWDRDFKNSEYPDGFDPTFHALEIGKALKVPPPLKSVNFVRYMLGQPLQFMPGSKRVYSNFGYCVLGRVIEKASEVDYIEYLNRDLFRPLGVKDIHLGRTLPKARDPREPVYLDAGEADSVIDSSVGKVRTPDGGFLLEAMDSHGGLVASAPDLLKVFDAYWMSGEPRRPGEQQEWVQFGSLPGTFAMASQRPDGVNVVVLMNQHVSGPLDRNEKILQVVNAAIDQIKEWPEPKPAN